MRHSSSATHLPTHTNRMCSGSSGTLMEDTSAHRDPFSARPILTLSPSALPIADACMALLPLNLMHLPSSTGSRTSVSTRQRRTVSPASASRPLWSLPRRGTNVRTCSHGAAHQLELTARTLIMPVQARPRRSCARTGVGRPRATSQCASVN